MDRLLNDIMKSRGSDPNGECPDAEQLAAWADGTIYGADADRIEAHLADCARCQAVLATFVATDPVAEPAGVVETEPTEAAPVVVPFTPRPSPARWAIPLIVGAAAASLILYVAWPKPPAIVAPTTTVARVAPAGDAPVTGTAIAPTPARTPVIGPAPKANANTKAASEPTMKPAAMAPPPQTASAPPPVVSLTPTPIASASPTPVAASTADMVVARMTATPPTSTTLVQTVSRGNTLSFITKLPEGGVEFGPTEPVAEVTLTPTRQGEAPRNPLKKIRWRVMLSGIVEKTIDGGTTWTRIVLDSGVAITSGASPSTTVCWLVGKAGAVLRSTDGGATFARVAAPTAVDLVSVIATDARTAMVSTADGRQLSTTDGGQTWR